MVLDKLPGICVHQLVKRGDQLSIRLDVAYAQLDVIGIHDCPEFELMVFWRICDNVVHVTVRTSVNLMKLEKSTLRRTHKIL